MGTNAARSFQRDPQGPPRISRQSPQENANKIDDAAPGLRPLREASEGILALEHVRRMRGGSQAHVMRCSDGHYYVVKFPNNPQGIRILACDLLGNLLAARLGLPAQPSRVIEVPEVLIRATEDLVIQLPRESVPCSPGKCFGSRCPVAKNGSIPLMNVAVDFWNTGMGDSVENVSDVAGILVFDQWTSNTDTRQLLFWRGFQERRWRLSMIDQGRCFNGARWNFPDSPLWGLYHGLGPYLREETLAPFEPWLERLEQGMDRNVLNELATSVPPEWYGGDRAALNSLLEQLDERRGRVRELIMRIKKSLPKGFFNAPGNLPDGFATRGADLSILPKPKSRNATA